MGKELSEVRQLGSKKRKTKATISPRYAWVQLRVDRSAIHRFGVFAAETIRPATKVIQYTGQRITKRQAERRLAMRMLAGKPQRVYVIRQNQRWLVDGSVGGSGAELINHSCDPNLTVRKIRGQILLFSRKRIRPGQELTIDYGFQCCEPCHCGSTNCRGTMCRGCIRRPAKD